jgi:hypothetical protein
MTFWYGITVRFMCDACNKTSAEHMALDSDRDDKDAIQKAVNLQKLKCQICKAPARDGTEISVHVEPGTPERLRKLGYPVPPDK